MTISDQSHINCVREALWQQPNGYASLMVGAGFSRNARKLAPDTPNFPLWNDFVSELCARLYPPSDDERLTRAKTEASGTSGFLRLSQEYEAAFGRGALHSLIQKLVPDDDFVPGEIHTRLLRLPWRDVFTTNWDTLLERARFFVADRAYSVVRTQAEIPSAPQPRIVKLHGSFPAHVPFVFTEEDYRTYPKRFSPFVNTVQQAMLETVFCLIGFSGDDPNFIHWSGWVRDNLGESAPKIYLAGWLDLSPHRRRMLETRNVVPIDLAHHPQAAHWPEHLRHRYATEWILHTLERGQPYDVTQWPSPSKPHHSQVLENLQPVEDVMVDAPQEEPRPPAWEAELARLPKQVHAIVEAWKQNRKVYPGWLVIPPSKQSHIRMYMDDWESAILRAAPELTPIERVSAIQELVWRRERLLEPLSERVEAAIQAVLDDVDCSARSIGGKEDLSLGWANIRQTWRELAMALLTAARQRLDRDAFDRHLTALLPFLSDHPDVAHRVHHEKCLWALYSLDFTALEELLRVWGATDCDPAWMTRKAAILVEIDRSAEAIRLLNRSLLAVREWSPGSGRALAGPSREGWTLWLTLAFERDSLRLSGEVLEAPSAFDRWQQLAALQCDARAQKRAFLEALRGDSEKKDGPLFDLGVRRHRTVLFSDAKNERRVAARRVVRLCEVAGLPPSAGHMIVASDILNLAADHLIATDYALAARLVLRLAVSEDDPTFNRVWSRPCIAAMPMNEVTVLIDIVTNAMAFVIPKAANTSALSTFWVTRLRVLMEALSRLVLRLPPKQVEDIFKRGLTYYGIEGVATARWLHKPMGNLLARSWEALPACGRAGLIFDVLSAPIFGVHGFAPSDPHYPDPGSLLVNDDETPGPARGPETELRWTEIVDLIVRGLRTGGEARKRAAFRVVPLALWGCLTDSEHDCVAQALWSMADAGPDSFPRETNLYDWVFLLLPQPEPDLAERRLRGRWFGSQERRDEKRLNEFLFQVGAGLNALSYHQRPLILKADERAILVAIIGEWCKFPVKSNDDPFATVGTREALVGLQSILAEVDLSSAVAEELLTKSVALNQTDSPGFRLFGGLAKSLPDRFYDIAMSMRIGLTSDNSTIAEEAVAGLEGWLMASEEGAFGICSPPDDLCREIGVMIANRRKGVLSAALRLACWIFAKGSSTHRDAIAQLTLDGLRYLIEELRYDREHSEDNEVDVPLLRRGCAHLALAMSQVGYETDPTVARWAQAVQDDPLPEVRHATRPVSVRSHGG